MNGLAFINNEIATNNVRMHENQMNGCKKIAGRGKKKIIINVKAVEKGGQYSFVSTLFLSAFSFVWAYRSLVILLQLPCVEKSLQWLIK